MFLISLYNDICKQCHICMCIKCLLIAILFDISVTGGSSSDHCKDVDVVSVLPDYSTSAIVRTSSVEAVGGDRFVKANAGVNSRSRILEDPSSDYDSGHDNMSMSSSMFEFQKAERAPQRVPVGPFSKPAPSKWDDAQKWIASPTSNRPKTVQSQGQGGQSGHVGPRKVGSLGYGSRQSSMKVVVEVPDQKEIALDEPDTKKIDTNQTKMDSGGQKFVSWEADPYAIASFCGKCLIVFWNSLLELSHKHTFCSL